ncbi:MAG: hypothetical protein U0M60_14270 [Clostridia bacterium]|nr:hypothetical protein [Clostridia bacterium]
MNIKPICVSYNINRKFGYNATEVISIECEEDFKTRYIDVYLYADNVRNTVDISGSIVTARMVTTPEYDSLLLSDNVACEVAGTGHIIIPIDSAVIAAYPCDFLVEVHIQNGENVLVLPFPLWVSMRASILDNAGVTPESQGTVPELLEEAIAALEEAKNYEKLENKPQINGHTLSGDKTSDDLGLQKKLTAGTNITLESDGTISASGGVTSYNDLENIPAIKTGEGDFVGTSLVDLPIKGTIHFDRDFFYYNSRFGKICLSDRVFKENNAGADYDFNDIPEVLFTSGWQIFDTSEIINLPQFLHSYSTIAIIQLCTPNATEHFIRGVLTLDNNQSKPRLFLQTATADFSMWWPKSYHIINQSEWVEVGGSQIVSGVVNQNGTITFTDSDGNTFTTTGSSVIGADGFSPVATVTPTASGATVSITDKNGTTTANISNGAPGQDYVLTEQDKSDIADIVLGELPTTEGVLYGNTNN